VLEEISIIITFCQKTSDEECINASLCEILDFLALRTFVEIYAIIEHINVNTFAYLCYKVRNFTIKSRVAMFGQI